MNDASSGRVPLIAGNWKMYKTSAEGAAFIRALAGTLGSVRGREIVVAPAFTGLHEAVEAAEGSGIEVSAQDVFWETQGAYTGEVSPGMLADLGVKAAIVGHSERRQVFGETDADVRRKLRALLDQGLAAIVCVGETEEQRDEGRTEEVLSLQVPAALTGVSVNEVARLAVAYEPIWAIGTGRTATPETAQDAAAFVRDLVRETIGEEAAAMVRVLYGGSVKPDNIDELMALPDVDGVLVGGASLDLDSFARIVRFEET